jgi:hypothetical protein
MVRAPRWGPGAEMTRLARNRDTHLTREEIAAEALRCFDESASAPSIRHLAEVPLRVTPSAIYPHLRECSQLQAGGESPGGTDGSSLPAKLSQVAAMIGSA